MIILDTENGVEIEAEGPSEKGSGGNFRGQREKGEHGLNRN